MEDAGRAEAAVAGGRVRPDLDLVRRGPAEVRQHRLVSVALRVVALILAAALLRHKHESQLPPVRQSSAGAPQHSERKDSARIRAQEGCRSGSRTLRRAVGDL